MKDDLKKKPLFPDLQGKLSEQRNHKHKKSLGKIPVERELLTSKAWLSLPSAAPCQVYLLFLGKKRMERVNRRKNDWIQTNNGEMVFTYLEAKKLGMTAPKFKRCIDVLMDRGFIDIAESGNTTTREPTKYSLLEDWRFYGKPGFAGKKRTPCKRGGSKDPFGRKKAKAGLSVAETIPGPTVHVPEEPAAHRMTITCGDCLYIGTLDCKRNKRRSADLQRRVERLRLDESREVCSEFQKSPS